MFYWKKTAGPTIVKENYDNKGNEPNSRVVQVTSKCGTLDNLKHKPGGGKQKVFNQKTVYK